MALDHELRAASQTKVGIDELLFAVAGAAGWFHPAALGVSYLQGLLGLSGGGLVNNPYFTQKEINGPSLLTEAMLRKRMAQGFGVTTAFLANATAGALSPVAPPIGLLRNGSAVTATSAHLSALDTLKQQYESCNPYRFNHHWHPERIKVILYWLDVVIKMKQTKMQTRGTELGLSALWTGLAFSGVGLAGLIPTYTVAVAVNLVRLAHKATYGEICKVIAMEMHWTAYNELSQFKHGDGPATKIIEEVMCRRSATRVFGEYDYRRMIREPAGWNAFAAKLMDV